MAVPWRLFRMMNGYLGSKYKLTLPVSDIHSICTSVAVPVPKLLYVQKRSCQATAPSQAHNCRQFEAEEEPQPPAPPAPLLPTNRKLHFRASALGSDGRLLDQPGETGRKTLPVQSGETRDPNCFILLLKRSSKNSFLRPLERYGLVCRPPFSSCRGHWPRPLDAFLMKI